MEEIGLGYVFLPDYHETAWMAQQVSMPFFHEIAGACNCSPGLVGLSRLGIILFAEHHSHAPDLSLDVAGDSHLALRRSFVSGEARYGAFYLDILGRGCRAELPGRFFDERYRIAAKEHPCNRARGLYGPCS